MVMRLTSTSTYTFMYYYLFIRSAVQLCFLQVLCKKRIMHHPPGLNVNHELRHPSQNVGSIFMQDYIISIFLSRKLPTNSVDKVGQFQFLIVIYKCLFKALCMLPRTLSFVFFGRAIPFISFFGTVCAQDTIQSYHPLKVYNI